MKLKFIEIAGFRGFKDKTRFEMSSGFVVLSGRNGAGKSTVLDAVDFALTGTINKYAVKTAKGGGLDDHIWWVGAGTPKTQYVSIGLLSDDGKEFVVRRSRERGLDGTADEILDMLCTEGLNREVSCETFVQTTLIRDDTIAALSLDLPEQARAAAVREAIGALGGPDHTERTGALRAAASDAKAQASARVDAVQAELGRGLTALTEAQSLARREADVAAAEEVVQALAPELPSAPGARVSGLRSHIAGWKKSISVLSDAVDHAERLETERLMLESPSTLAEVAAARRESAARRGEKNRADQALAIAGEKEALERANDGFASHMIALLDHGDALGLQDGRCPLCESARSADEFEMAIVSARARLSERGARAAAASAATDQARVASQEAAKALVAAEERLAGLEARQSALLREREGLEVVFKKWDLATTPSEPGKARKLLLQRQEQTAQLEFALFVLEASSAHDRISALQARVDHLRKQLSDDEGKLAATERAVEATDRIDDAAREVVNQLVTERFDTVMPLLKELYRRLRPHTDWHEIETDFGGRVRASLNFAVGDGRNPQFLFSSGQRRAAGLAFLLAIHLSRPWCRLQSLLLDDPVQHIDDYRALNLVEVLSAVRRTGRQVIVAVEDPALADLLCRRLRSTPTEMGRRFDLTTAKNGSATIERQVDVFPLPREILRAAEG